MEAMAPDAVATYRTGRLDRQVGQGAGMSPPFTHHQIFDPLLPPRFCLHPAKHLKVLHPPTVQVLKHT